jgi:hypothetical protein
VSQELLRLCTVLLPHDQQLGRTACPSAESNPLLYATPYCLQRIRHCGSPDPTRCVVSAHTIASCSSVSAVFARGTRHAEERHMCASQCVRSSFSLWSLAGGDLGTLTVTPTAATFHMKFLSQPISFDNVTICQHTFDAAAPHVLRLQQPYTLALSSPCAMATEAAAVVSTPRCRVSPGPTGSSQWAHAAIPSSSPNRTNVTLATCQQLTIDHRECAPAALAESSCECWS